MSSIFRSVQTRKDERGLRVQPGLLQAAGLPDTAVRAGQAMAKGLVVEEWWHVPGVLLVS